MATHLLGTILKEILKSTNYCREIIKRLCRGEKIFEGKDKIYIVQSMQS